MEGEISLIAEATRHSSRFLLRDYFELESLQSSNKAAATLNFSQKSCMKIFEALREKLGKYFSTIIFDPKDVATINFTGKAALVEVLDGLTNLTRSLPFFAIMVTILSNKNDQIIAEKSVINFPILGEIYYTEKGKGAWLERHSLNLPGSMRVRVSGTENIENAIASVNLDFLKEKKNIFDNIRIFESYTYSLSLLICGKVDAIIIEPSDISLMGAELFISEAGGVAYRDKGRLIASNFKLHEKIKSLI